MIPIIISVATDMIIGIVLILIMTRKTKDHYVDINPINLSMIPIGKYPNGGGGFKGYNYYVEGKNTSVLNGIGTYILSNSKPVNSVENSGYIISDLTSDFSKKIRGFMNNAIIFSDGQSNGILFPTQNGNTVWTNLLNIYLSGQTLYLYNQTLASATYSCGYIGMDSNIFPCGEWNRSKSIGSQCMSDNGVINCDDGLQCCNDICGNDQYKTDSSVTCQDQF